MSKITHSSNPLSVQTTFILTEWSSIKVIENITSKQSRKFSLHKLFFFFQAMATQLLYR